MPHHSFSTKPLKPFRLKCWEVGTAPEWVIFYTCGRPGRSGREESKDLPVSDELVHRWVLGLPRPGTAIISLLGRKHGPKGRSEFSFYSFCSEFDTGDERGNRLTFQEWLDLHHKELNILVREHPTFDYQTIPPKDVASIKAEIKGLYAKGRKVVLMDSGGMTRTGQVCKDMGAIEKFFNQDR